MSSHDQMKAEKVNVLSICDLPEKEQAELIADNFSKISNEYEPIDPSEIHLNPENDQPVPILEDFHVFEYLKRIKTNK